MKKIVDLLEAYVEWLVLGIGFVFLVMMVWTYLFPPGYVKKEVMISGVKKELTPGDVDEEIASGPADTLDKLVGGPNIEAPAVGSFVDAFDKGIAKPANTPPTELAVNLVNGQPLQLAVGPSIPGPRLPNRGGKQDIGGPVTALPDSLPAPQIVVSYAGQTTINPAATNAPAGAGAAGAGAAAPPTRKDIRWVTSAAIIPKSLTDQWNTFFGPAKAGGSPRLANPMTQILFIKVKRQEKSFDGQWLPETDVKQFEYSAPGPILKANNINDQRRYKSWAERNIQAIAMPDFPKRADGLAGTIWKEPQVILQAQIKSASPKSAELSPAQDFDVQVMITQNGPGPSGPPPITHITRPTPTPRGSTASPRTNGAAGTTTATGTSESLEPNIAADKNYHPASMPSEITNAQFNPSASSSDLMFDFHDDTVTAGHTYRYQVQYTLLNPVFDQPGVQADLAAQFGLDSKMSNWGPEIAVPPSTYFFCDKNFGRDDKNFVFDVFAWNDGKWHKHQFTLNPGDSIGQMAKDGDTDMDFSTRYSYVESGWSIDQKSIVTVVSDDGAIEIRETKNDVDGPLHRKVAYWAASPTQAGDTNPAVATAPPGGAAGDTQAPGMVHPPGGPPGLMVPMGPPPESLTTRLDRSSQRVQVQNPAA